MQEEPITIPKSEYLRLCFAELKLALLEANGVDNWDWYDEAMTEYEEAKALLEAKLFPPTE